MNDNVDLVVGCCARCGREHADDLKCTARKRMEAELMQGVLDFGGGASAPTHNSVLTVSGERQKGQTA